MTFPLRRIALVLLVAVASPVFAETFQAPLQFDKQNPKPSETLGLSINGKGKCKDIEINWGDDKIDLVGDHNFGPAGATPLTRPHVYGAAGTFTVTVKSAASGNGKCGTLSSPVAVTAPGTVAAKPIINISAGVLGAGKVSSQSCASPTFTAPVMTISAGKKITLAGCGFGSQSGEVLVKGTFNNSPGQVRKFIIDKWTDTEIVGALGLDITGAPDHVVYLQVIGATGAKSTDVAMNFVAKRKKVMLNINELDQASTPNPGIYEWKRASLTEQYQGGSCGATICLDRKLMPTPPFDLKGTDKFRLALKNGWAASSVKLIESDSGADFNAFGTTTGTKPTLVNTSGPQQISADVKWEVRGPLGWIRYRLGMEIEGPVGVPYR